MSVYVSCTRTRVLGPMFVSILRFLVPSSPMVGPPRDSEIELQSPFMKFNIWSSLPRPCLQRRPHRSRRFRPLAQERSRLSLPLHKCFRIWPSAPTQVAGRQFRGVFCNPQPQTSLQSTWNRIILLVDYSQEPAYVRSAAQPVS